MALGNKSNALQDEDGTPMGQGVIPVPRTPAWWLRAGLSLALAIAVLAAALPVAFGGGAWGGGVDPAQFF
jgi:hypothetical protein